jgi:hypothetical protein
MGDQTHPPRGRRSLDNLAKLGRGSRRRWRLSQRRPLGGSTTRTPTLDDPWSRRRCHPQFFVRRQYEGRMRRWWLDRYTLEELRKLGNLLGWR